MNNTYKKALERTLEGRPIAYHAIIAKASGSVKLGVLWSQINYWKDKGKDPDGWIYKTKEELFEETGLSRREQETARKIGTKLGIIEEKLAGTPPTMHYRVNVEATAELIDAYVKKETHKDLFPEKNEFSWEKKLKSLRESSRQDMNILGFFFERKGITFENQGEFQVALKRHLRAARDLVPFSDEKIKKAMEKAEKNLPGEWTLETIIKLITK